MIIKTTCPVLNKDFRERHHGGTPNLEVLVKFYDFPGNHEKPTDIICPEYKNKCRLKKNLKNEECIYTKWKPLNPE